MREMTKQKKTFEYHAELNLRLMIENVLLHGINLSQAEATRDLMPPAHWPHRFCLAPFLNSRYRS